MKRIYSVLIIFVIMLFCWKNFPQTAEKADSNLKKAIPYTSSSVVELKIAPLKNLSGMSKAQVLSLRKDAVAKSIFASSDYVPNPNVFDIEDGLPWISIHEISCNGIDKNENIGKGLSRESLGILNPAMMFYLSINSTKFSKYTSCSEIDYLIPHKMLYSPSAKTIRAYINYTDYYKKNKYFLNNFLSDTNARDFGYNYAYVNKLHNIRFKHSTNLSNSIVNTRGFYHKGYSCNLPSGCNNYSPYTPEYEFYLTNTSAAINIKLWKEYPKSVSQPADLNYQIIFE